jgi:hypothetical protein
VTFEYLKENNDPAASRITSKENIAIRSSINIGSNRDWLRGSDFRGLTEWLGRSTQQDFLTVQFNTQS